MISEDDTILIPDTHKRFENKAFYKEMDIEKASGLTASFKCCKATCHGSMQ